MLLLFVLFLVTALFYASVMHQAAPELIEGHQSQADALSNLDETVLSGEQEDSPQLEH
jgi:hypothetical protein